MQFYYGNKMPLRILDETEFWKRQEAEHTVVILQIVSNLEKKYVELLEEWGQVFNQTEAIAVRYIEMIIRAKYSLNPELEKEITQFINYSYHQSQKFILLLNEIATESKAVQNNQVALVVINHIRRESQYYIGIAKAFLNLSYPHNFIQRDGN
ncbi:MAG: DUF2935 domain-containing protein [Firmicutes bacterium]|nr:DUF2935 domain-containing protein [Bacillota bacterium]